MSDIQAIVNSLSGAGAGLVFALVILYGVYRFSDKIIDKLIAQLSNINIAIKDTNSELSKTRETLVALQHQQINLETRVVRIEDKIK